MSDQNNNRRIESRAFEVPIPTADGQAIAESISLLVPMEWDPELNEWLITPEGEELIETTKARHMGLLLPADLLALRQHLELTQSEIGELLKIGEKTWTRWESGRQRPSQSMNLMLLALQTGRLSLYDLQQLHTPSHDWSNVLEARNTPVHPTTISMVISGDEWCYDETAEAAAELELLSLAA
jgi:DNA-binding transcriptional regulator YiaG